MVVSLLGRACSLRSILRHRSVSVLVPLAIETIELRVTAAIGKASRFHPVLPWSAALVLGTPCRRRKTKNVELSIQSSTPTATRKIPLPSARNMLRALGGPYPTLAARDSPRVILLQQPHVPDNRAPPSPVSDYHNHKSPLPFPKLATFYKPNDQTTTISPASTPRLIADTPIAGFPRGSRAGHWLQ